MAHYKVKLQSMAKLPVGPGGVMGPLCDICVNKECSNPVDLVNITVFGIEKKIRLHKSGSSFMAVINCDGFIHSNTDQYVDDNEFDDIGNINNIDDLDDLGEL